MSLLTHLLIAQNKYRCATAEEQKEIFEGNSIDGIDGYISDSISLRQECLTPETKKRIHDLLFIEYDFKEKLLRRKKSMEEIFVPMAKRLTKSDTTKYKFVLDSLYLKDLAESISVYKSYKKSSKLIYLLGNIYYYEGLPMLKEMIKDSSRYSDPECFRLALARLGDKSSYDYYINKYSHLSQSNNEYYKKEELMRYLNTQESLWLFTEELKNKDLIIDSCSECPADIAYNYTMSTGFYLLLGHPKTSIHVPEAIKKWWISRREQLDGRQYSFKDAEKMYLEMERYVKGKFPLDERHR